MSGDTEAQKDLRDLPPPVPKPVSQQVRGEFPRAERGVWSMHPHLFYCPFNTEAARIPFSSRRNCPGMCPMKRATGLVHLQES